MSNKRRDKGDGSVFQTKDGEWRSKLVIGTKADGKPNIKTFYGKTELEVKKKLKAYKTELIKNDYVEVKKQTVRQYMNDWLYNVKKVELKPKSFDIKEATLNNQIFPYLGDIQIANVTANDVQRMINTLVEEGLSHSTVKKAYDALNGCFKLGIIKGEILKNPCLGVVLPKNQKKKSDIPVIFSDEEVNRIIAECRRKYRNGVPYYQAGNAIPLMIYTGLRMGEALALGWGDVDFENRQLSVGKNIVYVIDRDEDATTKYTLVEQDTTKTSAGLRTVYLNEKAIAALEELQKTNGKHRYVVSNSKGGAILPRNFNRMFSTILKNCGIEPVGTHSCRHTFASMLFKMGVDVKTVSELLGHANVQITYDTYIHLIKEQKRDALALLDKI